jgi:hypothetical protein
MEEMGDLDITLEEGVPEGVTLLYYTQEHTQQD